jgi:uncharacterized RDD family membrane protein YckC
MKCPKCGYLGFEAVERCRNCGYDFSLSPALALPELPMRESTGDAPRLEDLSLADASTTAAPAERPPARSVFDSDLDRLMTGKSREIVTELPLFGTADDDAPMITAVRPPRPPLAVRRATPEVPRLRTPQAQPRAAMLDLTPESESVSGSVHPPARSRSETWAQAPAADVLESATMSARFVALLVDAAILVVIDAVVIYFTMQICGLDVSELMLLPRGPLIAFLLVQNGGYLVALTASGQTLGKMIAGIKVVAANSNSPLDVGQAIVRTLAWAVLAIPAGLGFLTAFLSGDRRGLHDRLAGTRVVRASA